MDERNSASVRRVLDLVREHNGSGVDVRFSDLLGTWQHVSLPAGALSEARLSAMAIDDMPLRVRPGDLGLVLRIDPATARIDPVSETPAVVVIAEGAARGEGIDRPAIWDPRAIARRAEAVAIAERVGVDRCSVAIECSIFDDVRFGSSAHEAHYVVDSSAAPWNSAREEYPNLGHKLLAAGGDAPVAPADAFADLRDEVALALERVGVAVRVHRTVARDGGRIRFEIDAAGPVALADGIVWLKYCVRALARRQGKVATFMARPVTGGGGNAMTLGFTLSGGEPVARRFVGGLLEHVPSLCALTNPTTNGYGRLAAEGARLSWGWDGLGCAVVRMGPDPTGELLFRAPDPSANAYLALAATLLAGVDGITRACDPGPALEPGARARDVGKRLPTGLEGAIEALEGDHEYLLRGETFAPEVLRAWIEWKRTRELAELRLRPHPHEIELYFDA